MTGYEKSPDYGGRAPTLAHNVIAALLFVVITLLAGAALFGLGRAEGQEPQDLRIATWNLENLRYENGKEPTPRIDGDYALLKLLAIDMAADVIAFQEVENREAAWRVFDENDYDIYLSRRRPNSDGQIRTGFAVRRGLEVTQHPDLEELDVTGLGDLRHGVDVTVEFEGRPLRLLSVHLKSFCFSPSDFREGRHCETRLAQAEPLEGWIDQRATEGVAFAVLGDFNRRYDDPEDMEWEDFNDAEPAGLALVRPNEGVRPRCDPQYDQFVDHIILDARAAHWLEPGSFQEWGYEGALRSDGDLPADHCPISVNLRAPLEAN